MRPFQGAPPAQLFDSGWNQSWLLGVSADHVRQQVSTRLMELESWQTPRVLLLLSNPLDFLTAFIACAIAQCPVFLGNPTWQRDEQQQAKAIAHPHLIWIDQGSESFEHEAHHPDETGWIMIPTGGTSGQIKFAIHTWATLSAAVSGMQEFFFGTVPTPIHSCCTLPLYHVSGLMQVMRSLLTRGTLAVLPFKTFLEGASADAQLHSFLKPESRSHQDFFLSLVPTQLSRIFANFSPERIRWLAQFNCILLGGAPASPQLLQQARDHHLKLAPTYGMTETGAQVMTLKPEKFLQGCPPPGECLPHVQLKLISTSPETTGRMQWSGPSVCWGYYPQMNSTQIYLTDDIAKQLSPGSFQIKGRASRKIISGGENIYPEELEQVLMAMNGIEDVCVFGISDADWGEIAIAAYVTADDSISPPVLTQYMKASLAAYKCPKVWWRVPVIPRNLQGKANLKQLKNEWLSTSICNAGEVDSNATD